MPHTSQQNGKSERMLRTINNSICSFLFQAHMSPTYWVEALHMTTYLLNILPSTSIQNSTPHFRLFQNHPIYTHFCVFGSLCYPHLTTPRKLFPRSSPYVFIDYPSNHHGYWCLDLSSCKIIISRHVTFDENTFNFKSVTPIEPPSYIFLTLFPHRHHPLTIWPIPFISTHHIPYHYPLPSYSASSPFSDQTSSSLSNQSSVSPSSSSPFINMVPHKHVIPLPTHDMNTHGKSDIHKSIQRLNIHTTSISPVPGLIYRLYRTLTGKNPWMMNLMLLWLMILCSLYQDLKGSTLTCLCGFFITCFMQMVHSLTRKQDL